MIINFVVFASSLVFNKDMSEITDMLDFQSDACSGCVRSGGAFTIADEIIVDLSQDLITTLGDKRLSHISEIFADTQQTDVLLLQLELLGSVDARLIDVHGSIFWARLTRRGNRICVDDIDLAKSFAFDCEDLMDEQERYLAH